MMSMNMWWELGEEMYGVYSVHGRRPRGTWLESVKTDMAEVEIDEEDVQKEMEKECYEVEVLP